MIGSNDKTRIKEVLRWKLTEKTIEMRGGNLRSAVLHSFSNSMPLSTLHQIFAGL